MTILNPYAIYVRCDGSMDYDSKNTGGVGFVIEFPEQIKCEPIQKMIGRYEGANIETLELNAILQGLKEILKLFKIDAKMFSNLGGVVVVTDRFSLNDNMKTNPYRLKEYRRNKWNNHEGKPIKNAKLLDDIDKTRKKVSDALGVFVKIEFQPRKKNKIADKLAKAGKKKTVVNKTIANNGLKKGRRKFSGGVICYERLKKDDLLKVHIYLKELVGCQWELSVEFMGGDMMGDKLKIYVDKKLEKKFHRHHIYEIKVKNVYRHHIEIFRTITEMQKDETEK